MRLDGSIDTIENRISAIRAKAAVVETKEKFLSTFLGHARMEMKAIGKKALRQGEEDRGQLAAKHRLVTNTERMIKQKNAFVETEEALILQCQTMVAGGDAEVLKLLETLGHLVSAKERKRLTEAEYKKLTVLAKEKLDLRVAELPDHVASISNLENKLKEYRLDIDRFHSSCDRY